MQKGLEAFGRIYLLGGEEYHGWVKYTICSTILGFQGAVIVYFFNLRYSFPNFYIRPRYSLFLLTAGHFPVEEPGPFTITGVLWRAVIIEVKDAAGIGLNPEIVPPHAPRATALGRGRMCGPHVAGHAAPAAIVVPLVQLLGDPVCLFLPDKVIGAAWFFLQQGRPVEVNFDGLADELKRLDVHSVDILWGCKA